MLIEAGCITGLTKDKLNISNRIPDFEDQANGREKARIIFVASESHRNPDSFNWPDFGLYRDYKIGKSIELYGYYKLLLTTFSAELSRRLNPNGQCTTNVLSLCPGPVNSNIAREAPKVFHPILKIVFGIFFRSPAKAAIPVIYMAASKDFREAPFDYFFLMSRKKIDEKASDPGNGKRLWELSEALLKTITSAANQ
jgi:NAD(P)-dependent dehydrogenase (short-subunit alcohol dehydrogenase family)